MLNIFSVSLSISYKYNLTQIFSYSYYIAVFLCINKYSFYFQVNLAVADQLVVVVCFPFSLAPYVYRPWIYGETLCKITPFVQGTSVGVSVFTLLAISIDRFFAIYEPLKSRLLFSRRRVKWLLVCVWIVSMLVSLPMLFVNSVRIEGVKGFAEIATCRETWAANGSKQSYNVFVFLVLYVIPVLFMSLAYIRIGKTLWSTDSAIERRSYKGEMSNGSSNYVNKITRERRKIVRMLIMVAVMFAASWLPYHVITLYLDFNPNGYKIGMLAMYVYPMVQWFSLSNSAINPVCYCLLSKRFQSAFVYCCKRACCCWLCRVITGTSTFRTDSNRLRRSRRKFVGRSWTSVFRDSRCASIQERQKQSGSTPIKVMVNGVKCQSIEEDTKKDSHQSISKELNVENTMKEPKCNDAKTPPCGGSPCSSNVTRYSDNEISSTCSVPSCFMELKDKSPEPQPDDSRKQEYQAIQYETCV